MVNPNNDEGEGLIEIDLEKREIRGSIWLTVFIKGGENPQDLVAI